jgi:hypothetical protein
MNARVARREDARTRVGLLAAPNALTVTAGRRRLRTFGAGSCAAFLLGVAGCAAEGHSSPDRLLDPVAGRSVLVIFRERGAADVDCVHRIDVDDRTVAELRPGGWVTVYPSPGDHVVSVQLLGTACAGYASIRLQVTAGRDRRLETTTHDGFIAIKGLEGESL